jgi:hypothetical protein
MSVIGYEAKNKGVRGSLCNDCAEGIDCNSMNTVKSTEYRDVYCVNCHRNLEIKSSDNEPDQVNEKLCAILDEIFDGVYPMLGTGPGEEAEVKDIAPGVKFSEFPEDAVGQVLIMDNKDKVKDTLDSLVEKGHLRYVDHEDGPIVITCAK